MGLACSGACFNPSVGLVDRTATVHKIHTPATDFCRALRTHCASELTAPPPNPPVGQRSSRLPKTDAQPPTTSVTDAIEGCHLARICNADHSRRRRRRFPTSPIQYPASRGRRERGASKRNFAPRPHRHPRMRSRGSALRRSVDRAPRLMVLETRPAGGSAFATSMRRQSLSVRDQSAALLLMGATQSQRGTPSQSLSFPRLSGPGLTYSRRPTSGLPLASSTRDDPR